MQLRPPRPVIIDTDPGIDDMVALLAGLGAPELDVLAIGSVHGNVAVELGHDNTRRIVALAGRSEVPVGRGAARPLIATHSSPIHDIHGDDGLGNASELLPEVGEDDGLGAVELYRRILTEAETPVTLIALGPLTNIAALYAAHPEVLGRIDRLIMMGGAANCGNTTSVAEFNLACDPEAAERVFSDVVPITLIGFDLTRQVRFDRAWLGRLLDAGPISHATGRVAEFYLDYHESLGRVGMPVHDTVAVALAARPEFSTYVDTSVRVEHGSGPARGASVLQRKTPESGRAPVQHAVTADVDALADWVATSIGRLEA